MGKDAMLVSLVMKKETMMGPSFWPYGELREGCLVVERIS
jgi:hypothetical protein